MVATVLACFGVAAGCSGFFVNPTLSSLAIGPQSQTITANPTQTLQMSATGQYNDGSTKDLTGKVVWSSDAPTCATISKSGLVTPLTTVSGVCTTNISASFGTVTPVSTKVTVTQGTPSQIQLTASPTNPAANSNVTFKALATFSGTQQDITSSVTWNINPTSLLTLVNGNSTGTVSSNATGQTITVSASFGGVPSNTVTLTVQ